MEHESHTREESMSNWRGTLTAITGNGQAILSWDTEEGDLTDERVVLFQEYDYAQPHRRIADVTTPTGSVTAAGLTNGLPHVFQVRAYKPEHEHPVSRSNAVAVVPTASFVKPLADREYLAAALLGAMQAMQAENGWTFGDLREEDSYRDMWIETTGTIDLRDLADHVIAAMTR